jgi:hypothetical protein
MVASDFKTDDVKGIPPIPEQILDAASRGSLVVFIGAGVSRIIGCPSWKKFAKRLVRYLYENKCINFHEFENLKRLEPRKLLSICKRILEKDRETALPDLGSFLKAKDELLKKYPIYEMLYSFNAIYLTTNYDDYLDRIAGKVFYLKNDLLISNLEPGAVLHLHGSINDIGSIIMTTADYLQHYQRDSEAAALLEYIFKHYTVLFVGYGLEEYEILEFIVSRGTATKGELRHFMLYPIFKNEKNIFELQKMYYAELGITLIPYPIDERGYEHLFVVIEEWAKQIGPVSRPPGFYEKVKLIDEVI